MPRKVATKKQPAQPGFAPISSLWSMTRETANYYVMQQFGVEKPVSTYVGKAEAAAANWPPFSTGTKVRMTLELVVAGQVS